MPSHCDTGSLTTFPQAGAGLGGRGPWLGEHSKIRVLAQMCRAAPVSKILSSVYSWVVGWPGIWAFYSWLPTHPPSPTSPQEQHGSEGQLSLLLAAGNGQHTPRPSPRGISPGGTSPFSASLVWDALGISTQAPCGPGNGV